MKTMVITGGTGGIGIHTAIGLAQTGARVVVTGRNAERGAAAVARIKSESGNDAIELVIGDLSTIAGAHALAAAIANTVDRIDVLVNNAGLLTTERQVNADGIEANFAVNVVGTHHLTQALLPLLEAARPSRVLNLTGGTAAGPLDTSDLQAEKSFIALPSYSQTKRALEALSLHIAPKLQEQGVHLHVVYPGRASTSMTSAMTMKSLPWHLRPIYPIFRILIPKEDGGKSAKLAARSSIYAATTPDLEGKAGVYIDTQSKISALHPTVMDPANQAAVMAAIPAFKDSN